jgi:hypothetical protein
MGKVIGFNPLPAPATGPDFTNPIVDNSQQAANYFIKNYTKPFASQDEARTAVRFERKLELSGEGHRFFDFVRWGIAKDAVGAYLAYEGSKYPSGALLNTSFHPNKDEYLPIPQSQIDLLGKDVLAQNPGY